MGTYDLKKIAKECIADLNAIGIYPNITENEFTVNTRAKTRYGQCKYRNVQYEYDAKTLKRKPISATMSINISSFLLDDRNDINSVRQTVMHEALHACNECVGEHHGGKWLEYAELVNDCYNMNITRCSNFSERLDADVNKERMQSRQKNKAKVIRYTLKCPCCNSIIADAYRQRKPKWIMHTEDFYCKKCGKSTLGKLQVVS